MNMVSYIIVMDVALCAYVALEMSAICRWAPWAFRGIAVFHRCERVQGSSFQSVRIDQAVIVDEDLSNVGLRVKDLSSGSYLVQFPPKRHRPPEGDVFFSPVTGTIRVDYSSGTVEFTVRLTIGAFVFLVTGPIGLLLPAISSGRVGEFAFVMVFAIVGFLVMYQVMIKRRIVDFWFLLMSTLGTRSASSPTSQ